ncbi:MAG: hypothetical protein FJX57_11150 [Alphaproteobacteria bacterium]|nr:hypothetical protein [Alphaproteobacteria bacterium]
MAKRSLDHLPPEVRVRVSKSMYSAADTTVRAKATARIDAAFQAIARHYEVNITPPANPLTWSKLFMALASDFLPAFEWARSVPLRSAGRPPAVRDEALMKLFTERQRLAKHSNARACELLAKRWSEHPAENPFGNKPLSAARLRELLSDAVKLELQLRPLRGLLDPRLPLLSSRKHRRRKQVAGK